MIVYNSFKIKNYYLHINIFQKLIFHHKVNYNKIKKYINKRLIKIY